MASLILGQKRKAKAALDSAIQTISLAGQTAASGDYNTALSHYNQAIELLQSDAYRHWLQTGLIPQSVWTEQLAAARLGKVRSVAALDPRKVVFEQAERMLDDVFALRPDWPEPNEFMASLAISRGYTKNAAHYIDRLLAANPRHHRARFLQAVLDFDNGRYEQAIEKLSNVPGTAESLSYLSRCQLRTGRVESAINTLERGLARLGESYELRYYLGCALAQAGRFEAARTAFLAAASAEPHRPEPMVQLGNVFLILGETDDAQRYFVSAINLGQRCAAAAHYGLALIAAATDGNQFELHLDAIRQLEPNSDLLHCAMGDKCERDGCIEEARRHYMAVSPLGSAAPSVLARVGFMNYRLGDYTASVAALQKAVRMRPGDNRLLHLLGASAALSGNAQLAESAWTQLATRGAADEKTARALERARLWRIIDNVNHGQTTEVIDQMEKLYRDSGEDPAIGRALSDLYFVAALDLLDADPPDTHRAKELLLLGKHMTAHPRFEYSIAVADILERLYKPAIARLRGVLAANAKNPGASYHLGVALFRSGDLAAAEAAFRHGIAVSFKQASKVARLKWGLGVLLARQQQWSPALEALEGFESTDESALHPSPAEVLELKMRCLAGAGEWEAAERLAIGAPKRQQTAIGALILARRNMKSGRLEAALSHITHYLASTSDAPAANARLAAKARRAIGQLALRAAADHLVEGRVSEAQQLLTAALASLRSTGELGDVQAKIAALVTALSCNDDLRRIVRLAQSYQSLQIDPLLGSEDLTPSDFGIQVVLPPKSQRALDLIERPVFDPGEWDASPHPDPLVVFDS
jgi:tetratricopeptide (TPR) repeat protein